MKQKRQPRTPNADLLTTGQAARRIGISRQAVEKAVLCGRLDYVMVSVEHTRIRLADILEFARDR